MMTNREGLRTVWQWMERNASRRASFENGNSSDCLMMANQTRESKRQLLKRDCGVFHTSKFNLFSSL